MNLVNFYREKLYSSERVRVGVRTWVYYVSAGDAISTHRCHDVGVAVSPPARHELVPVSALLTRGTDRVDPLQCERFNSFSCQRRQLLLRVNYYRFVYFQ